MEVRTCEHGAASVVRIIGNMLTQTDCEPLLRAVRELVDNGKRMLVVNMANVRTLGPAGSKALVAALEATDTHGGSLKLVGLREHPGKALIAAGLDRLFDMCPDESAALAQLAAAQASATDASEGTSQWTARTVIEFPSAEGNITEAGRRFNSFLEQLRIDVAARLDLEVAFNEAFANAVKHGNKADSSKCVVAECVANDRMLKICVTDEGEGFDTRTAIAMKSNPFHDGGNGLALISNLMDKVSYNSKGNSVSLVKFCSQSPSQQEGGDDHEQVV
jgi:anti-anti-sigma factor